MTTYSTAAGLAQLVYRALPIGPSTDWRTWPGGVEKVTRGGWTLRIVNDPDEHNPHGLSWYLDSPNEPLYESGGWESLTDTQCREQASRLATMLTTYTAAETQAGAQ